MSRRFYVRYIPSKTTIHSLKAGQIYQVRGLVPGGIVLIDFPSQMMPFPSSAWEVVDEPRTMGHLRRLASLASMMKDFK